MQWHPIFAQLLRPLVQDYYEVRTDVPVGEAPRQADLVLLRRTSAAAPPFHGLWRHLTAWNVLEFKGPTVDARLRDLDLLVELGLGIDRRLHEDRERESQPPLPRGEVSFWYLANHLGHRFLAEVERLLGAPVPLGDGLWRAAALGRPVFLVSRDGLPVERESVPLHLVSREPLERELALAQQVVAQPGLWGLYSPWLAYLHPAIWQEVQRMARASGIEPTLDLRGLVDLVGLQQLVDQVGLQKVIDQVGLQKVIDQVGLQRVIDQVGVKRVVDEIGLKQFLSAIDPNAIASQLTPEEREEFLRRFRG